MLQEELVASFYSVMYKEVHCKLPMEFWRWKWRIPSAINDLVGKEKVLDWVKLDYSLEDIQTSYICALMLICKRQKRIPEVAPDNALSIVLPLPNLE